ncbi:MAG: hypothetical protein LBV67_02540 [Streptococcaceae bacterium]|nr:hypothetical protein [Streptococcaceae bacterium]
MFTIEQYSKTITVKLEEISHVLINNLHSIFQTDFLKEGSILLDFTLFIDYYPSLIAIRLFQLDIHETDVCESIEILPENEYFHIAESLVENDKFAEFYEANDEELPKLEEKTFFEWFKKCWETAGGPEVPITAIASRGFDGPYFNLRTQEVFQYRDEIPTSK